MVAFKSRSTVYGVSITGCVACNNNRYSKHFGIVASWCIIFQVACLYNQPEIVYLLIQKGYADPQERHRTTGAVALHEACAHGHIRCVEVSVSLSTCIHSNTRSKTIITDSTI